MNFYLKLALVNLIITILAVEYSLKVVSKYFKVDPKIIAANPSFNRPDAHLWHKNRFRYYIVGYFFLIPRAILNIGSLFVLTILCVIFMKGHPEGTKLTGIRHFLIRTSLWVCGRLNLYGQGIWNVKMKKVQKDYSKWLGPDYLKEQNSTPFSTLVANHSSYTDSMALVYNYEISFVSKDDIKKIPGFN
jgi:hypothetical protein